MKTRKILMTLVLLLSAITQIQADYTYTADGVTYRIGGITTRDHYGYVSSIDKDLKDIVIRDSVPDEKGLILPVRMVALACMEYNKVMTSISFPPTLSIFFSEGSPRTYSNTLREVHIKDLEAWSRIKYEIYLDDYYDVNRYQDCSPLNKPSAQLYLNGQPVTDLIIPEGVRYLNELVFCGNRFQSITIPSSLSRIDGFALKSYDDSTLKTVYAPDLKTWCNIDYRPYSTSWQGTSSHDYNYYPNFLQSDTRLYIDDKLVSGELSFPEEITTIKGHAFQNYSYITRVNIGKNITSIGGSAFADCKNLSTIRYEEGVINVPGLPMDPCYIQVGYASSFDYDESLYFTTLYLPSTVLSLSQPGFQFADYLKAVVIEANVPPKIEETRDQDLTLDINFNSDYLFSRYTYEEGTLYVPEGTAELYRNAEGWKYFNNIIEKEYVDVQAVEDSMSEGIDYSRPYEIYSVSGMRIGCSYDELPAGIYIILQNGKSRKIVRN